MSLGLESLTLEADPASAQVFEYSSLPSSRHIRLLELLPREETEQEDLPSPFHDDEQIVRCTLKTISLDDDPAYDALSYTWGNPITVYHDEKEAKGQAAVFKDPKVISCNGKQLAVTVNLYDALLALRRLPAKGTYEKIGGRPRTNYIWIDAICINQNDIAERNAQVQIMDQIYSKAQMTIVWLGRDDVFTRQAARVFQGLGKISLDKAPVMKLATQVMGSRNYEAFGLPKFDDGDWLAVYAFLHRTWFRRSWILQEVALAQRTVVLCGLLMMPWAMLAYSSDLMEKSKWYRDVAITAHNYMDGKSSSSLGGLINPGPREKYLFQVDRDDYFDPTRAVLGISETRGGLGIEDDFIKCSPDREQAGLTRLLQFFRYSASTEPRDKVYGLLGLIPKDTPSSVHIVVDYNKPVELVYLEAVEAQLQQEQDLRVLGHVQDAKGTKFKALPSWVPDYSVMLMPNPLSETQVRSREDNSLIAPFFAGQGLDFSFKLLKEPTPSLAVKGILYDMVTETAEFGSDYQLGNILNMVSELPHLYWDDVLERANEITKGDERENYDLNIKDGYLLAVGDMTGKQYDHRIFRTLR